jgi:hypothetical protein
MGSTEPCGLATRPVRAVHACLRRLPMDRISSGAKGRRRTLVLLAGALALALGPIGCGDDDEPEVDTVELQLINNTGLADLEVYIGGDGLPDRTYELDQSGEQYEDWTKVEYPLTAGIVMQFVLVNQAGDELARGSCTVSDAVALDYARVDFYEGSVGCSCGFDGTTGCEPGS